MYQDYNIYKNNESMKPQTVERLTGGSNAQNLTPFKYSYTSSYRVRNTLHSSESWRNKYKCEHVKYLCKWLLAD